MTIEVKEEKKKRKKRRRREGGIKGCEGVSYKEREEW